MSKAKFTKEITEKRVFTINDIDIESRTFTYLDEAGDEKEGHLDSVFTGIKLPLNVTIKTSNKEEFYVQFEKSDEEEDE